MESLLADLQASGASVPHVEFGPLMVIFRGAPDWETGLGVLADDDGTIVMLLFNPGHLHPLDRTDGLDLLRAILTGGCEVHVTARGGQVARTRTVVRYRGWTRVVRDRFFTAPLQRKRTYARLIGFAKNDRAAWHEVADLQASKVHFRSERID